MPRSWWSTMIESNMNRHVSNSSLVFLSPICPARSPSYSTPLSLNSLQLANSNPLSSFHAWQSSLLFTLLFVSGPSPSYPPVRGLNNSQTAHPSHLLLVGLRLLGALSHRHRPYRSAFPARLPRWYAQPSPVSSFTPSSFSSTPEVKPQESNPTNISPHPHENSRYSRPIRNALLRRFSQFLRRRRINKHTHTWGRLF